MTGERQAGLRAALEEAVSLLDRLDAQARDGGGARREVYLTVETWRDVFIPLRKRALAALAAQFQADEDATQAEYEQTVRSVQQPYSDD